jgi:acyl-homoserine-lactone acylase
VTRKLLIALGALAIIATSVPGSADGDYQATIRRTEHGIPHILGESYGDLGFGVGYAFAEDNLCVMADTFLTVNAERSRYLGPDGTYVSEANGVVPTNLDSDLYYQWINSSGIVEGLVDGSWPNSNPLGAAITESSEGWVAGYNAALADMRAAETGPACIDEEWVKPVDNLALYRRYYQLIMFASKGALLPYIVAATPPTPTVLDTEPNTSGVGNLPLPGKLGLGSNAYAIGTDGTDNGRGMVLGNPHFPWRGPERFYEFHLTWPGHVNVMGGALFGSPAVHIGTNDHVAWSHTVSVPYRFTTYELKLVPGDPTAYIWDGAIRHMKETTVSVDVLEPDDSIGTRSHTFYETHFGPVMDFTDALMPWTPVVAYALNDGNENNFRALEHFAEVNVAETTEEVFGILGEHVGIPWVNTIVADDRGTAFYADISVVPHITDDQILQCTTAVGEALKALARLPVLDGTRSSCQPGTDPSAPVPGIYGVDNLPYQFRTDYVANSNNSHWIANPADPLEGYPWVTGAERTVLEPRARLGLKMLGEKLDVASPDTFSLDELQDLVFNNRQGLGEVVRDDLVEMCRQTPVMVSSSGSVVDMAEACDVLEAWDVHANLGSKGAHLFREFTDLAYAATAGFWLDPFDSTDPVGSPSVMNTLNPEVRLALADAVEKLNDAGIALDAPLGDIQRAKRNDASIPIHGGSEHGMFNYIYSAFDGAAGGYPDTYYGSSFVMTATWDDIGVPRAEAILTYSLSTDPASPWFADQTEMYSQKEWQPLHMTEDAIATHLAVPAYVVTG